MLYAPIVPAKQLDTIVAYPYQMSLAQLVVQDRAYARFYRELVRNHSRFVILDNGAAEDGQMPYESWLEAIRTVRPTEVVLYDKLYDSTGTIESTETSHKVFVESNVRHHPRFMGVAHGESYDEIVEVAKWMNQQEYINTIGISKFLTRQFDQDEIRLVLIDELLYSMDFTKDIHVLGCERSLGELVDIKMFHRWVRGCDTALPTLFAKVEQRIRVTTPRPAVEIDFLGDDDTTVDRRLLSTNVSQMSEILL